jgi:hypothetical protein
MGGLADYSIAKNVNVAALRVLRPTSIAMREIYRSRERLRRRRTTKQTVGNALKSITKLSGSGITALPNLDPEARLAPKVRLQITQSPPSTSAGPLPSPSSFKA